MQAAVQDVGAVQVAVVLAAVAVVAFWRTVLKFAIMAAAIAVIATFAYGAIVIWQDMHRIAG